MAEPSSGGPIGPHELIIAPAALFAEVAARVLADRLSEAVRARGAASIALAGGGTPAPVYRCLATLAVPWPHVHVFFGDERRVPPDDAASNHRMARETLLDALDPQPAAVHRMHGEQADGDAAAAAYDALLPDRLDVVVLGMGDDGHTASLFPGSPALADDERRVRAVDGPPAGPARLTLTPRALAAARALVVLVAGASKAAVVADVFGTPPDPSRLPAQLALGGTWILDDAAAGRLSGRP